MKNEYHLIKGYLQLERSEDINIFLGCFIFFISIFNTAIIYFIEIENLKLTVLHPRVLVYVAIIIFFDLWAFYLMFNIQNKQKLFVLYLGTFFLAFSLMYLIHSLEIIYIVLKLESILYIECALSVYVLIQVIWMASIIRKIKNGFFKCTEEKPSMGGFSSLFYIALITSSIGTMAARVFNKVSSEQLRLLGLALGLLLFSYIFEFSIHNIYKYFLIKKYEKLTGRKVQAQA